MNRIKNVKHQWAVSYAVLVLIPMVIFLSILGVLENWLSRMCTRLTNWC